MAKTKHGPRSLKDNIVRSMMKVGEAKQWGPILRWRGLDGEGAVERLTRLLALHLTLDGSLTDVITMSFIHAPSWPSFKKVETVVASLPMHKRIELAEASLLISASCAKSIKMVNCVRNNLAHHQPKVGRDMARVHELSSQKAFDQCVEKGMSALRELVQTAARKPDEVSTKR